MRILVISKYSNKWLSNNNSVIINRTVNTKNVLIVECIPNNLYKFEEYFAMSKRNFEKIRTAQLKSIKKYMIEACLFFC